MPIDMIHPNMDDESSTLEHVRSLEELLAKPDVRHAPGQLARLIADDFREFGSSGRVFDKQQIIAALQRQAPCELSLRDFRAVLLAANVVLVTYCGTARFSGSTTASYSLRSSIWRRRDGRWEVVFHQGTPSEPSNQA